MGHSQMLLAVAGLKPSEIKERTGKLASGDWSAFAPAERLAFELAYKLSREPTAVSADDFAALSRAFGRHRAVDLVWYISWCNYMTRVADAFQLPLETENVFERPAEKAEPQEAGVKPSVTKPSQVQRQRRPGQAEAVTRPLALPPCSGLGSGVLVASSHRQRL